MIPSFENMDALKLDMERNPYCYYNGVEVYLEDLKETISFQSGEWVAKEEIPVEETPEVNGEISISLYEINQQLIKQLPDFNDEAWESVKEVLADLQEKTANNYYMLYSRELNYFTLFKKEVSSENDTFFEEVRACLNCVGAVRSFEFFDGNACEIWIKPEVADTVICMYLFPYDDGVVIFSE